MLNFEVITFLLRAVRNNMPMKEESAPMKEMQCFDYLRMHPNTISWYDRITMAGLVEVKWYLVRL